MTINELPKSGCEKLYMQEYILKLMDIKIFTIIPKI